jgi:perosamine synthetase
MIGRELPPTAGLPLTWRDFAPTRSPTPLEDGLARFLAVPRVQIECSGTASLLIALQTLRRMSARRTVVIPAYTCPLVALAVDRAGLRIRLCDTAADRFDFDPQALQAACSDDTLCILPTHLGGTVADLEPVLAAATRHGAFVVEDAAQALGATWRGRPVGTIGDVGFYSLARGKGLTLFEGGVLVARDPSLRDALAETSRALVPNRWTIEACRLVQLAGYAAAYRPAVLPVVYGLPRRYWLAHGDPARAVGDVAERIPLHRVSAFRKRIGAAALPRLEPWLQSAARRGRERAERISQLDGLEVVHGSADGEDTWPFLIVRFRSAATCERALGSLWRSRLGVTRLFAFDLTGYSFLETIVPRDPVPNARSLAARCLTISNSPWVSEEDFERVLEVLRRQ